jgi:hypothetical protein
MIGDAVDDVVVGATFKAHKIGVRFLAAMRFRRMGGLPARGKRHLGSQEFGLQQQVAAGSAGLKLSQEVLFS